MNLFSIDTLVNEIIMFLPVKNVIETRYLNRTFNEIATNIHNREVNTFVQVYNKTCDEIYNKLMRHLKKGTKKDYPMRKNCIFLNRLLFFYQPLLQQDIIVDKHQGYNVLLDLTNKYNWYIDEKTVLLGIHLHQNMNFKDERGHTALLEVAVGGTKKQFRMILKKGGNIGHRTKIPKRDLLDWSFVNNNLETQIELLINTKGLKNKFEVFYRILSFQFYYWLF